MTGPLTHATARFSSRLQSGDTGCETVQSIIDIAATAEAFAVTALGGVIDNALNGLLPLTDEAIQSLVAARASEQLHYEFLLAAGAEPLTLSFTIPDPTIVTDSAVLFPTLVALEEAFIAAYLAAAQQFSILGEPDLAQVALQIGAVEAEHRAGVRFFGIEAGVLEGVPNDVAFEKALFAQVAEAADLLTELGFIGGSGTVIEYPGPGEIDTTGLTQLEP
ncbi:MAG TPA: ferritin-like domain-containing protein [Thermomicrobiales bacterium]|nr:ferritin-like domain-containing protein [Thermomicrobiales bacterium]